LFVRSLSQALSDTPGSNRLGRQPVPPLDELQGDGGITGAMHAGAKTGCRQWQAPPRRPTEKKKIVKASAIGTCVAEEQLFEP
jgi:hypothetical protein